MTSRGSFLQPLLAPLLCAALMVCVGAAEAQGCPKECNCFGKFVSCHQFTEESLAHLPLDVDTIILNNGKVRAFPADFASRFKQLTFLELQYSQVEVLNEGSFSGLSGLDQLAFVECEFGTIETGAFQDVRSLSQFHISETKIGTIRPRAFFDIHDVGTFSVWSSSVERVDSAAFQNLSDFHSFAFYLNNVTVLAEDAFVDVDNLGKVDVYLNRFVSTRGRGEGLARLAAATSDMNLYSNVFSCQCDILRAFHTLALSPFLLSQKCAMVDSGTVVKLSEVDVNEICAATAGHQFSSSTSSPQTDTTTTTTTITSRSPLPSHKPNLTSTAKPESVKPTTSSSKQDLTSPQIATKDSNLGSSTPVSKGQGGQPTASPDVVHPTSSTSVMGDVTSSTSTARHNSGSGTNSGLSDGGATDIGSGVKSTAQSSLVSTLATLLASCIASRVISCQVL